MPISLLPFEKSQNILQRLALGLLKADRLSIAQSTLLNSLEKQPVFAQEDVSPKDFLKQIETVSELLVQRDLGEYEFPHLSFQGYFAASYLEQQGDRAYAVILENWDKSDAWRETILFYTAQLPPKQFTEMLEQVCKLGTNSAKLAFECLRQYRNPERIDQGWNSRLKSLMDDVKALLYQNLDNYLKNQQWYEANQETWKLMLKVANREEEGWLYAENIEAFPCEDLRKIDQLWVHYSNSKFGFSIQKKVWLECGGVIGKVNDHVWDKFAKKVGWDQHNHLRSYTVFMNDAKNAQKALPASLPGIILYCNFYCNFCGYKPEPGLVYCSDCGAYLEDRAERLFSLIETCEL